MSAITTVALLGEPMVYAALAAMVRTTVSSPSTSESSFGVTVIVTDDAPAAMVAEVPNSA